MKTRVIFVAGIALLVGALISTTGSAFAQGRNGTTLEASATMYGVWTRTFDWTIEKTVDVPVWNMFDGDTAKSVYTVSVEKDEGTDDTYLAGEVCVLNGGGVSTEDLAIVAEITIPPSKVVIATANVDVSEHPVLSPGEEYCYEYEVPLPDAIQGENYKISANVTIMNHSGSLGDPKGPSPDASAIFPSTPDLIHDSVTVTDTNGKSWEEVSTSEEWSYPAIFSCPSSDMYENTATITETGESASADVTVTCYDLLVSKTAKTSFDRTYSWTVSKSADQTALTLSPSQQFTVNYTVTADASFTDSNWQVSGDIVVENPAPISAVLNNLSDILPESLAIDVDCGSVAFPYTLSADESLTCSYTASLPDATARTNTATVVLQNYAYDVEGMESTETSEYSGSASFDFISAETHEINETAIITDTYAEESPVVLGTLTYGVDTLPASYTYSKVVGPYDAGTTVSLPNEIVLTTETTTDNPPTDDWTVTITVPNPSAGCTLTIGYWKNHAGFGPQKDMITALLPVWLGNVSGAKSLSVITPTMAVNILGMKTYGSPSNGITKLYAQLLAAKLNIKGGANASAVAPTITAADSLLAAKSWTDWNGLSKTDKQNVQNWMSTLDKYNNGLIGPGHCSE